ncbi:MAG: universal stress protein [Verrucomicrobiales bacterium]|nr:universal stress protein [Verrucomicrobiales bacterium]
MKLERIVVGIDFSEPSDRALVEAVRLAEADGAKVVAVNVLDQDLLEGFGEERRAVERELLEEAPGRLEAHLAEIVGDGHGIESEFVIGHPFRGVAEIVEGSDANVLVIGADGVGGGDEGHVGAVATKFVRAAKSDVLLLRGSHRGRFKKVLACVDLSPASGKALARAAHVARVDGADLEVFYVRRVAGELIVKHRIMRHFSHRLPELADDEGGHLHDELRLKEFTRPFVDEELDLRTKRKVLARGDVRGAIVEEVMDSGATLVVLGTHGWGHVGTHLLGTTAEEVIRQAACPVWVARL